MTLKWKDLITSPDGRLSHTKLGANIAGLTATWVIIWYAWELDLTTEMFSVYLLTVGGFNAVGKYLDLKHGNKAPEPTPTPAPIDEVK